jgi:hypothetical protein
VLEHSPDWIDRKYNQTFRERWENSQARIMEGFKSISLVLDAVFNQGKNFNEMMPDSYEKAIEKQINQNERESKFIKNQWWKS